MKKSNYFIIFLLLAVLLNSCSSVSVLSAWKSDDVNSLTDKNVLVVARTNNNQVRIAIEEELSKQLAEKGINCTPSFKVFPKQIDPNEKLSEVQQKEIKSMLESQDYNGVVVSVLKDYDESTVTRTDGGYYAGGTYASYYPRYYGGFYGYYGHPMAYSTYGNYVPSTTTTYTSKTYILESVAYNLDLEDTKQLVAVVTSKIVDPNDVNKNAKEYAKKVVKAVADAK